MIRSRVVRAVRLTFVTFGCPRVRADESSAVDSGESDLSGRSLDDERGGESADSVAILPSSTYFGEEAEPAVA